MRTRSSRRTGDKASRDSSDVLALVATHLEFQCRRHTRFAPRPGYTARAVGSPAGHLAHRRELLERVGQADHDHSVVEQGAVEGGDGRLLAAVLAGSAAKNAADLADECAAHPKGAGLIEEVAHLRRHVAEAGWSAEQDQVVLIQFGTPTRFGNMAAQMRNFLDQTGALWMSGALVGKVGSVFCSTASQHGGQETTITSFHSTLLHHGMIVVGLPYTFKELTTMREVTGGTPYGASCVTGAGSETRMPTALELQMCRYQGEHVARITARLVSGSA